MALVLHCMFIHFFAYFLRFNIIATTIIIFFLRAPEKYIIGWISLSFLLLCSEYIIFTHPCSHFWPMSTLYAFFAYFNARSDNIFFPSRFPLHPTFLSSSHLLFLYEPPLPFYLFTSSLFSFPPPFHPRPQQSKIILIIIFTILDDTITILSSNWLT